ncbi:hypothetical protein [Neorhodopirellula pilleata]|uniref:Uncharacterized protein n=1 Tax=Neorhodopirellula pilleata TaxID=2714738 RepID=A0A5C6ADE8_9BACT|nr:hypothetical protein [Neorhodopirellula pilleata]TWT97437.1 hypothetical protein Pla100_25890 [Neorhodopirellula pilleata]
MANEWSVKRQGLFRRSASPPLGAITLPKQHFSNSFLNARVEENVFLGFFTIDIDYDSPFARIKFDRVVAKMNVLVSDLRNIEL